MGPSTADPGTVDLWTVTRQFEDVVQACEALQPVERPRWLAWAQENLVNQDGRPYDHAAYPHLGAPGGPSDAWDDRRVRQIALQFGSRLGKTFFGQGSLLYVADVEPGPCMHANATQTVCEQVLDRLYKMLRHRPRLYAKLAKQNEREQKKNEIEFRGNMLYGAWSLSVSTLADKDIKFGHAGEIDKWKQPSTSTEGHPWKLFSDRFKNYQSARKVIVEGTPSVRGNSLVETSRLAGTNCRLEVPCPHCRRYQKLELGKREEKWGLRWDAPEGGRSDGALAFRTARYVCRYCLKPCEDRHRAWMIRRGVWVPEGCQVDDAAALEVAEDRMRPCDNQQHGTWLGWSKASWIKGRPLRDGPEASYQLSSLYALTLSWGDIAKEFVDCAGKPQLLQNFVNQWLGETWEHRKSQSDPEKVAARLRVDREGLVPAWGRMLVCAADRQAADGSFVKWVVLALGDADRAEIVARGQCGTLAELSDQVMSRQWPHADGGEPMGITITGVDCGWDTKKTYAFVNDHERCFAVRGSDGDLGGQPYELRAVGNRSRTGAEGQLIFWVNTDFWETDLQHRLDSSVAEGEGCLNLCRSASGDPELLAELLNGILSDGVDRRGNERTLWVKRYETQPNDWRDGTRYGLALGAAWIEENGLPVRAIAASQARPIEEDDGGFVRRPRADENGNWIRRG